MRLLRALKARQPTSKVAIAKNKVVWWAQSVGAAVAGKRGPGESLGLALLAEAGEIEGESARVLAESQRLATVEEHRLHGEIDELTKELRKTEDLCVEAKMIREEDRKTTRREAPSTAAGEIDTDG